MKIQETEPVIVTVPTVSKWEREKLERLKEKRGVPETGRSRVH